MKLNSEIRPQAGSSLLNSGAGRYFKESDKHLLAGSCTILVFSTAYSNPPLIDAKSPAQPGAVKQVAVNRTVPNVEPPRSTLEFSARPTTQEIFRARVFEEPLVPIGGEPTPAENAALGAALIDYAKRSSPGGFSGLTGFLEKTRIC